MKSLVSNGVLSYNAVEDAVENVTSSESVKPSWGLFLEDYNVAFRRALPRVPPVDVDFMADVEA